MYTGTVKFFNVSKGFGFITPDGGGDNIFVHFTEIQQAGFKELTEGQRVSYVSAKGERGMMATNVQILDQ